MDLLRVRTSWLSDVYALPLRLSQLFLIFFLWRALAAVHYASAAVWLLFIARVLCVHVFLFLGASASVFCLAHFRFCALMGSLMCDASVGLWEGCVLMYAYPCIPSHQLFFV